MPFAVLLPLFWRGICGYPAAMPATDLLQQASAIAPRIAAELYDLKIVAEGIEDAHDNTTRFVVLAREALDPAALAGAPAASASRVSAPNQLLRYIGAAHEVNRVHATFKLTHVVKANLVAALGIGQASIAFLYGDPANGLWRGSSGRYKSFFR